MHAFERPFPLSYAKLARRPPKACVARPHNYYACKSLSDNRQPSAVDPWASPLPTSTVRQPNHSGLEHDAPSLLDRACRAALAIAFSVALALTPATDPAWIRPHRVASAQAAEAYSVAAYESAVAGRRDGGGDGPNLSLFTEDAQLAMASLREYGRYVESVADAERRCGPACAEHREVLEAAWQVVASEHFSASGTFSQAAWADRLLAEMRSRGGLLPTQSDLQAAVTALLASLGDPYTEYLPPAAFRRALRRPLPREQSYLRAQYVGLGLELGPVAPGGGRLVVAPLAGSPAEAAGIARGDRLVSIDGTPVDLLSSEQLRALMRGPAGSTATLEWVPAPTANAAAAAAVPLQQPPHGGGARLPPLPFLRSPGGGAPPRVVKDVERRDLPQPAIKVSKIPMGPPGFYVTYVRLLYFGSETTEGLAEALRRHEGAPGNTGYILDLRNNPGGVFEEAIASASLFLRPGCVVAKTIRGPEGLVDAVWQVGHLPAEVFPAPPGRLAVKPVVLLANRSSASASEVFAGALRDNSRAPLLGEPTFGKGLVQYYFPLREGKDGGLRVTVAKYLTPSGYDISGRKAGLTPDQVCSDFPHGGLPTSLDQSDRCIRQAAQMLAGSDVRPALWRPGRG